MTLDRRALLSGLAVSGMMASGARAQDDPFNLQGRPVQGGHLIGRTWPRALVFLDGEALTTASADGWFIVGFDRDAPLSHRITARSGSREHSTEVTLAQGQFPSHSISGLPPSTVAPQDPALLARIREQAAVKAEAYASRLDADYFREGFSAPLETMRVTSAWGSQRILNGTPAQPHYGVDLGAPTGAPITAPAAGLVTLAESDFHYEGGLIFIDHGQGLITAYLHQSRVEVSVGQTVYRGQLIGRVGARGRATGPHLCWRMKWRDRNLDPSLLLRV